MRRRFEAGNNRLKKHQAIVATMATIVFLAFDLPCCYLLLLGYSEQRMEIPLFRRRKPGAVLVVTIFFHPLHSRRQPVVLHRVSNQHVHGRVKKVCYIQDHRQLWEREAGLPFLDGASRHPQYLGKLSLCQPPLFPERTNIFGKCQLHFRSTPFCFRVDYIQSSDETQHTVNTNGFLFYILKVWFFGIRKKRRKQLPSKLTPFRAPFLCLNVEKGD